MINKYLLWLYIEMKIAILIPGCLRFKDIKHFNNFKKQIEDYDIYIYLHMKNMKIYVKN